MKTYVTFGFDHKHQICGITFDKDCVASIECDNAAEGRAKAFEVFGSKFCFEYPEFEFNHDKLMPYFHRGIIPVPQCPNCLSTNVNLSHKEDDVYITGTYFEFCEDCGEQWGHK